ncbi:MAG: hypothetical protein ABIH21_01445 [Patescibacteria group bacterium]
MPKLITVGQIIDQTWDHYRHRFSELMSVSVWLLILVILNVISLMFYPVATKIMSDLEFTGLEIFGVVLFGFTNLILAPLLNLWLLIALIKLVKAQFAQKKITISEALKDGFRHFLPVLWVVILILAILILAVLIGYVPGFVIAWFGSLIGSGFVILLANLILIIGIVATIVLIVRWTIFYALSTYAVLWEEKRGSQALKKSKTLIQGRFWHAFALFIIPKLLLIIISAVILYALYYVFHLILSASGGISAEIQARLITLGDVVFPMLIAVLINPLVIISDTKLYNSLKEVAGPK